MDIVTTRETCHLDNKISQEELAGKRDVAFSTVNRWVNKRSKPNKIQTHPIKNY